jgi:prepilin-type N-terminal cleavage/methylation domain-containing protein
VEKNHPCEREDGFSLLEVMIAMVVLAFSLLGAVGMFQVGTRGLQQGAKGMRALALAEARLEAKRTVRWNALLRDDLDFDGTAETEMRDDGLPPDEKSGDGIYTAESWQDDVHLIWTVELDRSNALPYAPLAIIHARAEYHTMDGRLRTVGMGTLRTNPAYVGMR